jgi:hypothetical protein
MSISCNVGPNPGDFTAFVKGKRRTLTGMALLSRLTPCDIVRSSQQRGAGLLQERLREEGRCEISGEL